MNYQKALSYFKDNNIKLDIIFLDPPYETSYIEQSIIIANEDNLLSDDGIIVCESNGLDKIIYPDNFKVVKEKKYGDKYIVIIKKM